MFFKCQKKTFPDNNIRRKEANRETNPFFSSKWVKKGCYLHRSALGFLGYILKS